MESTPKLNAFLIVDTVIQEAGTNKYSVIGVFDNIRAYHFPTMHSSLSLYVNFTDARGYYRIKFELVDLQNNTIIGRGEGIECNVSDPLASVEFAVHLKGLVFPHEGGYEFRFWANERIIGQKTFRVIQMGSPSRPESGGEE